MGEPVRVGRALAMEAAYLGTQGAPRRGRMLARWALQIADETGDPYVRALYHGSMSALVGYSESRWRASQAEIERSTDLFRAHHQAAGWETDTLQFLRVRESPDARRAAEAWMRGQGIRDPARMTDMILPG